jgi:MATE family multidrug resistance protein
VAWPAILRQTINCASDRVTLALVGHYDHALAHYDGAGLGKMYSNITGLSVGLGISLGLSTLCSQAHGAGLSRQMNAVYLRQCASILAVVLVYTSVATAFGEPVLLAMNQPSDVAAASARFAQVQLVGVPFFWAAQCLQTVCDGMQDTKPGLYSNLAASGVQILLCFAFVHPRLLGLGYLGMAAARSVGGVLQFGTLVGYIIHRELQPLVWRLSPHARAEAYSWRGVRAFLRIALPAAFVWWLEWWSFEGLTVEVGLRIAAHHAAA